MEGFHVRQQSCERKVLLGIRRGRTGIWGEVSPATCASAGLAWTGSSHHRLAEPLLKTASSRGAVLQAAFSAGLAMASGEWALSTALLFRPNVYFKPFDSCGEHIGWAPGPRMLLAGFSFHYFPICKVGENSSNGWLWRQTVKTKFLLVKYCKFTVKHHRRAQCAVGTSHITGGICWQFIPQPLHPHPSQEHRSPYPPAQPQRRQQLK